MPHQLKSASQAVLSPVSNFHKSTMLSPHAFGADDSVGGAATNYTFTMVFTADTMVVAIFFLGITYHFVAALRHADVKSHNKKGDGGRICIPVLFGI